jgi:hypothetical protein
MSSQTLAKDDPKYMLAVYKNQTEVVIEALIDFQNWVEEYMPNVDEEQVDFLSGAIAMYLRQDDKSQKLIAEEEQRLLKRWTNG